MAFDYIFKNKKVAAVGFGIEGESAVNFLLKEKAKVFVFDEKKEEDFDEEKLRKYKSAGVQFSFGPFGDLTSFDVIVRTPGINPNIKSLEEARQKGIPTTTGIDIFLNISPAYTIGVTGTKGKGTTSTLIYEILRKEKSEVFLGGNIGTPPLSFLDKLTPKSIAVLELSSFQLIDVTKSPNFAVVLMVTSEHMDFHASEEEYTEAKGNILKFQKPGDYAVVNDDYENSRRIGELARVPIYWLSRKKAVSPGAYIGDSAVVFQYVDGKKEKIIKIDEIFIPGEHNLENVCAAVAVAKLMEISNESIVEVLKTFKGLKYRLQFLENIKGVRYYNDSFGTTPESTIAAIEAFKNPKILILGGSSKGSNFEELARVISEEKTIKAIIGIGVEWPKIKKMIVEMIQETDGQLPKAIEGCTSMQEIVNSAAKEAETGDVVILSPACASFDMFKNYKDRGNQFEKEVQKILKASS